MDVKQAVAEQIENSTAALEILNNKAFKQITTDMAKEFYDEFLAQTDNPSHLLVAHIRANVLREIVGRLNSAVQAGHIGVERMAKMKE